jgi:predicted Fe-Mo cluster-binding NifX family protein
MKIAVASNDGQSLSAHFGQSKCFIVYTIEDGKVLAKEDRDNRFTAHARGLCDHRTEHSHEQPHSHNDIIAALKDCQAMLCGGMGWPAAMDLQAHGIRPVIVADANMTPDAAVEALLAGTLAMTGSFCQCHH